MMLPCCSRHKSLHLYRQKLQQGLVIRLLPLVIRLLQQALKTIRRITNETPTNRYRHRIQCK